MQCLIGQTDAYAWCFRFVAKILVLIIFIFISLFFYYPYCSPLSRQDLISWKMALEKRQLPEAVRKVA